MKSNEVYARITHIKDREELEKFVPDVKGVHTPFYICSTGHSYLVLKERAGDISTTHEKVELNVFLEMLEKDLWYFGVETYGLLNESTTHTVGQPFGSIDGHAFSGPMFGQQRMFNNMPDSNPTFGPTPNFGPRPTASQSNNAHRDANTSATLIISLTLNNVKEILDLINISGEYNEVLTSTLSNVTMFPTVVVLDVKSLKLKTTNGYIVDTFGVNNGRHRDSVSREQEFKTFIALLDTVNKKDNK